MNGQVSWVGSLSCGQVLDFGNLASVVVVRVHPHGVANVISGVNEIVVVSQPGSMDATGAVVSHIRGRFLEHTRVVNCDGQ